MLSIFGGIFNIDEKQTAKQLCYNNGMTYMDLPNSMLNPAERCWKHHTQMANQLAKQHYEKYGTLENFTYIGESKID